MQPLDPSQVPKIRHLVSGAIAGLTPERVTVVDLNGRSYSGAKGDGPGSVLEDPYAERVRFYQDHYETMIRDALNYVDGVTVTASVILDREIKHHEEKNHVDPKAVAINVREESDTKQVENGARRAGRDSRRSAPTRRPNSPRPGLRTPRKNARAAKSRTWYRTTTRPRTTSG